MVAEDALVYRARSCGKGVFCGTATGTISSSNRPLAQASAARRWLRTA
jgi:hypothetical protein